MSPTGLNVVSSKKNKENKRFGRGKNLSEALFLFRLKNDRKKLPFAKPDFRKKAAEADFEKNASCPKRAGGGKRRGLKGSQDKRPPCAESELAGTDCPEIRKRVDKKEGVSRS